MSVEEIRAKLAPIFARKGTGKAILFGSHSRGTADRRSDVDLLIVDDHDQRYLDRIDKYFVEISDALQAPVDLLVYTRGELERMADRPFIGLILKEGVTLYER